MVFVIVPGPAGRGDKVAFADLEGFALDDQPRAVAFQDETDRAGHVAVGQGVFTGLEQLQIEHQRTRCAVLERRVPQLNDAAKRDIQADNVAGFFHGGKKIFAFPKASVERRHRLAIDIPLLVLPVAFEILALQFFFEGFKCFRHRSTSVLYLNLFYLDSHRGCKARKN